MEHAVERIKTAATEELEHFRLELEAAGLTWSEPEFETWPDVGTEIRVRFYRDGDLVDVLEDFVSRHGVLIASEDEVRTWIRDVVREVVASQTRRSDHLLRQRE